MTKNSSNSTDSAIEKIKQSDFKDPDIDFMVHNNTQFIFDPNDGIWKTSEIPLSVFPHTFKNLWKKKRSPQENYITDDEGYFIISGSNKVTKKKFLHDDNDDDSFIESVKYLWGEDKNWGEDNNYDNDDEVDGDNGDDEEFRLIVSI